MGTSSRGPCLPVALPRALWAACPSSAEALIGRCLPAIVGQVEAAEPVHHHIALGQQVLRAERVEFIVPLLLHGVMVYVLHGRKSYRLGDHHPYSDRIWTFRMTTSPLAFGHRLDVLKAGRPPVPGRTIVLGVVSPPVRDLGVPSENRPSTAGVRTWDLWPS